MRASWIRMQIDNEKSKKRKKRLLNFVSILKFLENLLFHLLKFFTSSFWKILLLIFFPWIRIQTKSHAEVDSNTNYQVRGSETLIYLESWFFLCISVYKKISESQRFFAASNHNFFKNDMKYRYLYHLRNEPVYKMLKFILQVDWCQSPSELHARKNVSTIGNYSKNKEMSPFA